MAGKSFFKPKWQHSDPKVRLEAVKKIRPSEHRTLSTIASEDDSREVRMAALDQINSLTVLESISRAADQDMQEALGRRAGLLLYESILAANDPSEQRDALNRLADPELITAIAVSRLPVELRLQAVSKLNDPEMVCRVLENNCGKACAVAAVDRLSGKSYLLRAADNSTSKTGRRLAAEKLFALEEDARQNSAKQQEQALTDILSEAEKLVVLADLELVSYRIAELLEQWLQIDPAETHALRPAFDGFWRIIENRLQEEQRRLAEEQRLGDIAANHLEINEEICVLIESLIGSTDPQAKQKMVDAEARWHACQLALDPLYLPEKARKYPHGDRFLIGCRRYRKISRIIVGEQKVLAGFSRQCRNLEKIIEADPLQADKPLAELCLEVTSCQLEYLHTAELVGRLRTLQARIADYRSQALAARERKLQENLGAREEICSRIEALAGLSRTDGNEKEVAGLQKIWEGMTVLPREMAGDIGRRYDQAVKQFYNRQGQQLSEHEWQLWSNRQIKEELCCQVESLDAEQDLEKVSRAIKNAQAAWKEIGPAGRKEDNVLWRRFRGACNRNYARCLPYFEECDRQRLENQAHKEALCRKAEAVLQSADWQAGLPAIQKLQQEWQGIGQVPKKLEGKLHKRFQRIVDEFLEKRQEYRQKQDARQDRHGDLKEALCAEVEALLEKPQWGQRSGIQQLQKKWQKIGAAARNRERQLWKRFQAACNAYFAWCDQTQSYQKNATTKQQLIAEAERLLEADGEDPGQAAETIRALEEKWTAVGPVGREVEEELRRRFVFACDCLSGEGREAFARMRQNRQENLRKKEILCLRLERVAGIEASSMGPAWKNTCLTVAEMLKISLEANAMMKDVVDKHKIRRQVIVNIREEWKGIGSAGYEQDHTLQHRFEKDCAMAMQTGASKGRVKPPARPRKHR